MKLTQKVIELEILKREKAKGRDLNVTQVRTCLRHLWEILEGYSEVWQSNTYGANRSVDIIHSDHTALLFCKDRIDYYRNKSQPKPGTRLGKGPSRSRKRGVKE